MLTLGAKAEERLVQVIRCAAGEDLRLRTLLDEWAAFTEGNDLVTRNGRQRWLNYPCPHEHGDRLLKHMDWITPRAKAVLEGGRAKLPDYKKRPGRPDWEHRLIVDHAVPIKVLKEELRRREDWTIASVLEFLAQFYKRGVILKVEDQLLDDAGLKERMPEGWDRRDPFSRYHAVGLSRVRGLS
jgi:hypothetical protein